MSRYVVIFALLMGGGCYDSIGEAPLDNDAVLADLSDEEYRLMCEWHAASEGFPDRPALECDGFSRSPYSPLECMTHRLNREDDPECHATVADWVACRRAVGDDLCRVYLPECRWEGCSLSMP